MKPNFLSTIPKHIPLLSSIILIGAIFYEWLYFGNFGVEIFTFLSFSEIINLFISHLPKILLTLVAVLFFALFFEIISGFQSEPKRYQRLNRESFEKFRRRTSKISFYIMSLTFVVGLFLPIMIPRLARSPDFLIIRYIFFVPLLFMAFSGFINKDSQAIHYNKLIVFVIVIFFISIYALNSYNLLTFRQDKFPPERIEIKLVSDSTIITSKKLLYIGKTNQYIFLFHDDLIDPYTQIIPMNQVKGIKQFRFVRFFRLP